MRERNVDLKGKTVLVTGGTGFIGANLIQRLLQTVVPIHVVSIDNMNDYYDPALKRWRLKKIIEVAKEKEAAGSSFEFVEGSVADTKTVQSIFTRTKPDVVVNLAAQAGVRYSIDHPDAYITSNIIGFYNILEACRHSYDNGAAGVAHLVYASSSSVYGGNTKMPYSVEDQTDTPVSLYAATKKSNELLAHAYAKLYNIPATGLRFFTVYGPAGRPDMAYFKFTNMLRRGGTIQIFNYGNCMRDFTYVDDIAEGIFRVISCAPERRAGKDGLAIAPHKVYNIGNNQPVNLLEFVDILHQELVHAGLLPKDFDFEAHTKLVPMQAGDVPATYADTAPLERDFGFKPTTDLRTGLRNFAAWYREFYLAEDNDARGQIGSITGLTP